MRQRLVIGGLTWENEQTTKDGPGGCANTRTPGPNPRVSEGYGMSTPRATHPCHGVR